MKACWGGTKGSAATKLMAPTAEFFYPSSMADGPVPGLKEKVVANLREIDAWVGTNGVLPTFENNDEFMTFALEVMNRALYLLKVGATLVPRHAQLRGVSKRRAIALGHLVRLMKLYDCLTLHTAHDHREICFIFFRLILEAAIRLDYLLLSNASSFRNFVLVSYRPEKEHLVDLARKAKERKLLPIEKRIMNSVKRHIRRDGLRISEVLANHRWELDGKNIRTMSEAVGFEPWGYSYGFGNGSHFIHGDWRDISMHHVHKIGRYYEPNVEYGITDPRLVCPVTKLCLQVLRRFLAWHKSDPDGFVRRIIAGVAKVNASLDEAHERYLQTQN